MVNRAMHELKLKEPIDPMRSPKKFKRVSTPLHFPTRRRRRLVASDESHPFMTAYVIAGLPRPEPTR